MRPEAEKPDWWHENKDLREQMDLPPYRPPRFLDDVYIYKVVNCLEQKHDVRILFVGRNTRYGEDWEITVNDERVDSISRHRDGNSNTVYELESEEFREIVENSLVHADSNERHNS